MKMTKTLLLWAFKVCVVAEMVSGLHRANTGVWLHHTFFDDSETTVSQADYSVMTEVISSRFGTILLGPAPPLQEWPPSSSESPSDYPNLPWVPSIVATQNRERAAKGLTPTQVMVSFNSKLSTRGGLSSFQVAKRMADEANALFPRTVTTLVFISDAAASVVNLGTFSKSVSIATIKMGGGDDIKGLVKAKQELTALSTNGGGSFKYTLGAVTDMHRCLTLNKSWSSIKDLLPHVDTLLVYIGDDRYSAFEYTVLLHKDPYKRSPESLLWNRNYSFIKSPDEFWVEECDKKLASVGKPISVVPFVILNDTQPNPGTWEVMSEWAFENNRSVIMFEAFDEYRDSMDGPKGHGWWGIVPHWKRGQPLSSDVFVEKAHEGWHDWKCTAGFNNMNSTRDEERRYNNRISVFFDPNVHPRRHKIYPSELGELLRLVASKFQTIIVEPLQPHKQSFEVPNIAAKYNAEVNNSRKLELILSFKVEPNGKSTLDKAQALADKANGIFPGTVSTLMFLGINDYIAFTKQVRFQSYTKHYEMATFLEIWNCKNVSFLRLPTKANPPGEFLPYVDYVAVYLWMATEPPRHQLFHELHKPIEELTECANKLRKNKPGLRVIPGVGYSSNGTTLRQTWMWMREWAEANNESVVMFSAFDLPYHGHPSLGWWRLKNGFRGNLTLNSFEEKALTDNDSDDDGGACHRGYAEHQEYRGGTLIGIVITIVVMLVLAGLSFMLYWKRDRIFSRMGEGTMYVQFSGN